MKAKVFTLFAFLICLISKNSFSQNVIHVSSSSNLFISSGNIVSLDSLVLIPSEDFNMSGENSVTKNNVISHPSANPAINRAYLFANPLPFSGSVTLYYLVNELNGFPENSLELNIYNNDHWESYSTGVVRDAVILHAA